MVDDQFKKTNSFWTIKKETTATLHTIILISYLRQATTFADYKVKTVTITMYVSS